MDKNTTCDTCGSLVELKGDSTSISMCKTCYKIVLDFESQCDKDEKEFIKFTKELRSEG